ncbi:MAG: carboxylating nicotinate-nucleotide diphosphorylase [Planctomycetes bacterium]|nr:carboxylating nicotinate-nucleotide diphosphorylase [Planctomycetota bacterium]
MYRSRPGCIFFKRERRRPSSDRPRFNGKGWHGAKSRTRIRVNWSELTVQLIRAAREEDLGGVGDITSRLVGRPDEPAAARVVSRGTGILSGLALAPLICTEYAISLDSPLHWAALAPFADGAAVKAGDAVGALRGSAQTLLTVERTLLNFLARMSGVATLTRRLVDAARAANPNVRVLDTRKTLPGWRELDKYAVRCGGGENHRFGLYDAILIKDNHLAGIPTPRLAAELFEMLNRASELDAKPAFVEVEVDDLDQLREVCKVVGVNTILLDNFNSSQLREAVQLRDALGLRGKIELESSGGVSLETIGEIAATGVDRISVGALTHSATGLDIALDFVT